MRILIVSNIFPPEVIGGYEIECAQVADALHQRGHEILVLTSGHDEDKINETSNYPIQRTLNLCLPFGQQITSAMRWRKWVIGLYNARITQKAMASFKPDLLFFWSPLRLGIGPARAAIKEKLPIVWRFGDESIAGYLPRGSLSSIKEIYRYLCDHLFFSSSTLLGIPFKHSSCISKITKNRLIKEGLPLEESSVIYKSIPIELFPLKQGAGECSIHPKILYVGLLHPNKGVHTLIKACKKLHRQGINVKLTIVGRGTSEYISELKNLSEEQMPTRFLGHIHYSEISKVYQEHDIFVFPSEGMEGQGTTYLEAMSSGLAVVGTSVGGQGELLHDDFNALVFEAGNTDSLAAAIARLIKDKTLYKTLVSQGRDYIEKNFSFQMFIDKLEALLIHAQGNL